MFLAILLAVIGCSVKSNLPMVATVDMVETVAPVYEAPVKTDTLANKDTLIVKPVITKAIIAPIITRVDSQKVALRDIQAIMLQLTKNDSTYKTLIELQKNEIRSRDRQIASLGDTINSLKRQRIDVQGSQKKEEIGMAFMQYFIFFGGAFMILGGIIGWQVRGTFEDKKNLNYK